MDLIVLALVICELVAAFIIGACVIGYLQSIIKEIWRKVRHKDPIDKKVFNPIEMFRSWDTGEIEKPAKSTIMLMIIVCVGTIYFLLCTFHSSTRIGSLLEAAEYTEEYEAIIYIEEKPVHCIATIDKRGRGDYWIAEILLPYGKTHFFTNQEQYSPNRENNSVFLDHNWINICKIELIRLANEQSYELVENEVVCSYGPYCASRQSNVYHTRGCPSAQNINDENRVFFASEQEADVLGFEPCGLCLGG